MKIAFVSDDGSNISAHFGRAKFYVVIESENKQIINRRLISKESMLCNCHDHKGERNHKKGRHQEIFEAIQDCNILISRGMGKGAFQRLETLGVQSILTEVNDIDEALSAYLNGKLKNVPGLLH